MTLGGIYKTRGITLTVTTRTKGEHLTVDYQSEGGRTRGGYHFNLEEDVEAPSRSDIQKKLDREVLARCDICGERFLAYAEQDTDCHTCSTARWKERRKAEEAEKVAKYKAPVQEEQDRYQRWRELKQEALDYLAGRPNTITRFRNHLMPLFREMISKVARPLKRKPNISLRLIAEGKPKAKLLCLPFWNSRGKVSCYTSIDVEWLIEEDVIAPDGTPAKKWQRLLRASLDAKGMPLHSYRYDSVVATVKRVIRTMKEFNIDSRKVIARGSDNCAVCGRCLTDELSRSRGIGPCCILLTDNALFVTERSIVVAED
jgi:hypothetical protein